MPHTTEERIYTTHLWHKELADGIESIDAYAARLREIADGLAEMAADGVAFAPGAAVQDGSVSLQTTDPVVAARYGLEAADDDIDEQDPQPDGMEDMRAAFAVAAGPTPSAVERLSATTLDDATPDDRASGPYVGLVSHRWFADGIDTMADYVERWRQCARDVTAMAAGGVTFVPGAIVDHGVAEVTTTSVDVARRYQFVTQRQMYGEIEQDLEPL